MGEQQINKETAKRTKKWERTNKQRETRKRTKKCERTNKQRETAKRTKKWERTTKTQIETTTKTQEMSKHQQRINQ